MLGLSQSHLGLVELIRRHQFLVEEVLLALEVGLSLLQVDLSQTDTHLCTRQLRHVRYHLDLGNHVASIHIVARLLQQFADDTRDLRFDVHLVARLNLTCDNSGLLDGVELRGKLVVNHFLRLALLPQERECSNENQRDNYGDNQFSVLFHTFIYLLILNS